jgi:chorismate mutase
MSIRGIRGAVIADDNQAASILCASRALLEAILHANPTLAASDVASVLFTVTEDLNAAHPAKAARELGWSEVPLMCAQEIPVPGSLAHCIRVLIHWNTDIPQNEVQHVYLGEAASLRPDLSIRRLSS